MLHGLSNQFLYSAYKVESTFTRGMDKPICLRGTGFWTKNSNSKLVLVTNRHMVDAEFGNPNLYGYELSKLSVSGKVNDESTGLPTLDQCWTVDHSGLKFSGISENDIACLVEPVCISTLPVPSIIENWIQNDLFATKKDFDDQITVCDLVAFPGYPMWYDQRQNRPIMRTGTISSDPRYDYSWSNKYEGECVAYEAFSYGGSSGSPVFAVQKGPKPGPGISFPGFRDVKMVGINAGHLPATKDTHSGISYMYKSSAILEIID